MLNNILIVKSKIKITEYCKVHWLYFGLEMFTVQKRGICLHKTHSYNSKTKGIRNKGKPNSNQLYYNLMCIDRLKVYQKNPSNICLVRMK